MFVGAVGRGWEWITLGLYLAGALFVPSPPRLPHQIADSLTPEQMLRALDKMIDASRSQLTSEMLAHLASIRSSAADVLPRLAGGVTFGDLHTVRQTILNYLPETLARYVALPPAFRSSRPLKEGKTAKQLMTEQLGLLDEQLQQTVTSIAQGDAEALLANDLFLRQRFLKPNFFAD
jgi:hypothetical protein